MNGKSGGGGDENRKWTWSLFHLSESTDHFTDGSNFLWWRLFQLPIPSRNSHAHTFVHDLTTHFPGSEEIENGVRKRERGLQKGEKIS